MKNKKLNVRSVATNLRLSFCTHQAATYAVENWHYSHQMPAGKLVKIGIWENNSFIGVIIFGRGANNHLHMPYDLKVTEVCELTRVALKEHISPVTHLISQAIRLLRQSNPNLKLIVSFADARQKHLGIIYQAGNWIYAGQIHTTPDWFYKGQWRHQRTIHSLRGSVKGLTQKRDGGIRFRYLYPLNKKIRKKLATMSMSYPKTL